MALEGCTDWRYVVEELQRAGIVATWPGPGWGEERPPRASALRVTADHVKGGMPECEMSRARPLRRSSVIRLAIGLWDWIEPKENPSAAVFGTIAVGAVLAAEDSLRETVAKTVAATLIVLGLYWLAHTYAHLVGERFSGERSLSVGQLRGALAHEGGIIKGATIPIVVLVICWAGGIGLETAVTAGLWASAATLGCFEIVVALRRRDRWPLVALEGLLGLALGAGLLLVHKVLG